MSLIEVFLIAIGLAADAFAVSVSAGSSGAMQKPRSMFRLSFHFGLFQFLMPVLGWLAGISVVQYIQSLDHWIAFGLLAWVGFRMIRSAQKEESNSQKKDPSKGMTLVILSVATSIDALAVGFSLAILHISIWYPAVVIGVITGTTSFAGIMLGRKFSNKFNRRAEQAGGVLLILIGIRILLAHLFNL